jgi:Domain of unknown function (DUF4878)
MSNPSGSDEETQPTADDAGAETEQVTFAESAGGGDEPSADPPERRFTAPSGFDAGKTQVISTVSEPATEVFAPVEGPTNTAAPTEPIAASTPVAPQLIPGRDDTPTPTQRRHSWGWVIAVVLVILAIVAVAIFGTVLLTRDESPAVSQQDMVRSTIENFDTAIQKGDLATLRSITCGETADSYVKYDDKQWSDIHARVAAARQYPVVASIDQVVVHDTHAEANVTTFMAFDPSTRSTRSFDLEFRDEQWKICQAAG